MKDIQKNDDGTLKILYGDTDSKPMYISFSAFETIEEAKQELDAISQRIGIYTNAQTSNTYINQYYEEKRWVAGTSVLMDELYSLALWLSGKVTFFLAYSQAEWYNSAVIISSF